MPLALSVVKLSFVTTLSLLLLATPSSAQSKYDWAVRESRPFDRNWLAGSKAAIEAEPCCAPADSGKWPAPEEEPFLNQLAGKVARDDKILRLALDGGRTLEITDCRDADGCKAQARQHRLVGWWPASHHYIVRVQVSGIPWFELISQKDGGVTSVYAPPLLSPSGRYAIAFQSTPVVDGIPFSVVDLATEPPKVVDFAKPTCAGFDSNALLRPDPAWIDDSHVRFEGNPPWPNVDLTHKQLLNVAGVRPAWEC